MNLEYMKDSLFEISKKKKTFSRYSNFLRCTCNTIFDLAMSIQKLIKNIIKPPELHILLLYFMSFMEREMFGPYWLLICGQIPKDSSYLSFLVKKEITFQTHAIN